MEPYALRGGQEGYDRLAILSKDQWPYTSALLRRVGVARGMKCVDLGCGGGEVTLEIAKLVGPEGLAVGVDMDAVKLDLGRRAASQRGITNVDFKTANVNAWDEPDTYDLVYSRFLLEHLGRPLDLLSRMWDAVRIGGVLAVEDADHDGWYCHPQNDGFDFFVRTFAQAIDSAGGDHAFGRKLYQGFLGVGIPAPEVCLVQSARTRGDVKRMAWLTLDITKESIISRGIASPEEVNSALDDLERVTEDDQSLIGAPRVFQVWSRR